MPNNPPAGTPSAVEELRQEFFKYGYVERGVVDALIAAARAEEREKIKEENSETLRHLYLDIPKTVRAATLAEVRRVVEGMPEDEEITDAKGESYDEREGWRAGATTRKYTILAALDAMEGK